MNKRVRIVNPLMAVAIFGLVLGGVSVAFGKIITNVPADISADDVKAVVVEDFETGLEGWKIESSPKRFNTSDANKAKKDPVISLEIKGLAGAPSDLVPESWSADGRGTKKEKILAIHFQFKYPGYNNVTIIPPQPIRFPGRVQGMSMWVHGRGKDYYLEAIVKDYTGQSHIIKFGSLNFVGWKPLKAMIPGNIPQSIESYPQTKTLVLEKFVVRSSPSEMTEEVFFAFDQLKVLTESFEVNFDGQDLDKAFKTDAGQQGGQAQQGQQTGIK